jgi:hypothetical protein
VKRHILTTEYRSYFSISQQATQFIAGIAEREWLDFVRRAGTLDLSLATGRPPAGVAERVEGSSARLWELRVTPNSRRGPKIRFLYLRLGDDILVVRCIRKRAPAFRRREVELADRDAKAWRKERQKRRS